MSVATFADSDPSLSEHYSLRRITFYQRTDVPLGLFLCALFSEGLPNKIRLYCYENFRVTLIIEKMHPSIDHETLVNDNDQKPSSGVVQCGKASAYMCFKRINWSCGYGMLYEPAHLAHLAHLAFVWDVNKPPFLQNSCSDGQPNKILCWTSSLRGLKPGLRRPLSQEGKRISFGKFLQMCFSPESVLADSLINFSLDQKVAVVYREKISVLKVKSFQLLGSTIQNVSCSTIFITAKGRGRRGILKTWFTWGIWADRGAMVKAGDERNNKDCKGSIQYRRRTRNEAAGYNI